MNVKLRVLMFIILFSSCSTNNEITNDFKGVYKITSMVTSIEIDANNDGIRSSDFLNEISSPHMTNNGIYSGFYNSEHINNYADVRPQFNSNNNAQLIAFNIPKQEISYLTENIQEPILIGYSTSFVNYSYEFTNTNEIKIRDNNESYSIEQGEKVISLFRHNKQSFELNISKKVFDFVEKKWLNVEMKVNYQKK